MTGEDKKVKRQLLATELLVLMAVCVLTVLYITLYGLGKYRYDVPTAFVTEYVRSVDTEERTQTIMDYWVDCDAVETERQLTLLLLGNKREAVDVAVKFSSIDYIEYQLLDANGEAIAPPLGIFFSLGEGSKIKSAKVSRQQPFSRYDVEYEELWR